MGGVGDSICSFLFRSRVKIYHCGNLILELMKAYELNNTINLAHK